MAASAARLALMEQILDRVRESRYPSRELLDRVEKGLQTVDEATDYLGVLIEKVSSDRYPSLELIDRAMRIAQAIEIANARQEAESEAA